MTATIDFYFDFVSPYSYLAHTILPNLARSHGATINYHPITLLELMQKVGNRPTTIECRNKGTYVMADLQRWAKRYQVGFAPNPFWQIIDLPLLARGALAAIDDGRGADYVTAVFRAFWSEAADLSQPATLVAVLAQADIDGGRLLQRATTAEYAAKLENDTAVAAERGVFGSPTMFVGTEMFFGNDRFDFMSQALAATA
jgi:2-hydroxychromene-2-carboxylate isomerase